MLSLYHIVWSIKSVDRFRSRAFDFLHPIKMDEIQDFNWKLESPACVMISGSSGSGKTWLTRSLLQRCNEIFDKPVHKILWCYTEHQGPLMEDLKQTIPSIEFHKGLPEEIDNPDTSKHMVLILDDLIHECKNDKMQAMFVRVSHHHNFSVRTHIYCPYIVIS